MPVDPDALPRPSERRLAVRVTKDALRHIRAGHPWVFDRSITSVRGDAHAGDLAVIFDDRRRFVAVGLWDPDSPIRIKVLHAGEPTPIGPDHWRARLAAALRRRAELSESSETDVYRIIHGENDGVPGLVLDLYGPVAVLKLYSAAWIPHLRDFLPAIADVVAPTSVVLRLARVVARQAPPGLVEGATLIGPAVEEPLLFRENGLTFEAFPLTGQKTGHFLDQRDNRRHVRELSSRADVLDVFCCTGGFSVHAAAGGARSVLGVDSSERAVGSALRNFAHNRDVSAVARCHHRVTAGDAFETMQFLVESGDRFDLVVVDPPSFAPRARDVPRAWRAYRQLTRLALDLIRPGGVLVQSSCSSHISDHEFYAGVHDAAASHGSELIEMARTGHAADHPIGFPEGAYLKSLFARVGDG